MPLTHLMKRLRKYWGVYSLRTLENPSWPSDNAPFPEAHSVSPNCPAGPAAALLCKYSSVRAIRCRLFCCSQLIAILDCQDHLKNGVRGPRSPWIAWLPGYNRADGRPDELTILNAAAFLFRERRSLIQSPRNPGHATILQPEVTPSLVSKVD